MINYQAVFTRYSSVTCVREISAPETFSADDFTDAFTKATMIMRGMRGCDRDKKYEYDIVGISSHGYSGITHTGFIGIWSSAPSDAAVSS